MLKIEEVEFAINELLIYFAVLGIASAGVLWWLINIVIFVTWAPIVLCSMCILASILCISYLLLLKYKK